MAVLCFVVYMFRRNKKNSVAAALTRRRSSVAMEREYNRRVSVRGAVDDEKLEGKQVNIFAADDEKIIPDAAAISMLTQVPTDEEIKELLRGKTAAEKRGLLREIEKAKQQKIHLEYILE